MGVSEISVKKGMDKTFNINIKDSSGNAKDITGWTVYFMVKSDLDDADSDAKISKTITSHDNPTGGVTSFSVDREDTEDLDADTYFYDIQIVNSSGLWRGSSVDNFVINPSVKLDD
jgi:hypothetical protein